MSYEEFVEKIYEKLDDLYCPFDDVWCERSSCKNCKLMKEMYERRKENEES